MIQRLSKKKLALFLLTSGLTSSAFATSNGTITFNGKVVDSPCTVTSSSQNQTIQLGQIKVSDVTGASGTRIGNKTPFTINLENCSSTLSDGTTAWSKMAVKFTDNVSAGNTADALTNTGTATGVSVGILNADDSVITLGSNVKRHQCIIKF